MNDKKATNLDYTHKSVLVNEVIANLNAAKGDVVIDCNFGGGGHSIEMLKSGVKVIGIDYDRDSIKYGKTKYSEFINSGNLELVEANFNSIDKILEKCKPVLGIESSPKAILFDLGLSNHQIKVSKKGFSFSDDAELDMRASETLGVKASDLIKVLSVAQLEEVLREYGEVDSPRLYAKFLKSYAQKYNLIIAKDLAANINLYFKKVKNIHPATQVFQALRILVNNEIENLIEALNKSVNILGVNGRLLVITFHSLEEKALFVSLKPHKNMVRIYKEPIRATFEELKYNISSRSAKLYVYEKVSD